MTGLGTIFDAIAAGDMNAVRAAIREDPSAASARDEGGVSALLQAQYRGRADLVAVIRPAAGDLDMFEAAALGDTGRVEALLDTEPALAASWSADGFTPLHLAVFFGHSGTARELLRRGADLGSVSRNPMTVLPIHSAAAGRDAASVRVLLDAGADVDTPSHAGFTALHDAAANGDGEIVELLLERGADPSHETDAGKTAADLALERGHVEVADRLRARG